MKNLWLVPLDPRMDVLKRRYEQGDMAKTEDEKRLFYGRWLYEHGFVSDGQKDIRRAA
ncbi:MAG: hypothetical protein ACRDGS_14125 [Chloroflexota bacterium]